MGDEVTVHMNATPQQVWALVSDVTQIGRYSPETFEGEWLDGATGPAVGVRFRGHVKRNQKGPTYWAKCYVTASEPGKEFSFGVGEPGKAAINWGYRLAPGANGGTDVTEYFELAPKLPMKIYWTLLGWSRGKTNRNGMQTTLERIKKVAEADAATEGSPHGE
ncbi:MAG: SRPBCC family protein [Actinobacteria bacterium]|nr:SRPBCC family protein [Actinomycetota bacterium]MTA45454.1 SRPBCC family protein [Actinomycetota bacterium]MTB23135.1 SRPBCC family protein [Actinomycetota bacterium]